MSVFLITVNQQSGKPEVSEIADREAPAPEGVVVSVSGCDSVLITREFIERYAELFRGTESITRSEFCEKLYPKAEQAVAGFEVSDLSYEGELGSSMNIGRECLRPGFECRKCGFRVTSGSPGKRYMSIETDCENHTVTFSDSPDFAPAGSKASVPKLHDERCGECGSVGLHRIRCPDHPANKGIDKQND